MSILDKTINDVSISSKVKSLGLSIGEEVIDTFYGKGKIVGISNGRFIIYFDRKITASAKNQVQIHSNWDYLAGKLNCCMAISKGSLIKAEEPIKSKTSLDKKHAEEQLAKLGLSLGEKVKLNNPTATGTIVGWYSRPADGFTAGIPIVRAIGLSKSEVDRFLKHDPIDNKDIHHYDSDSSLGDFIAWSPVGINKIDSSDEIKKSIVDDLHKINFSIGEKVKVQWSNNTYIDGIVVGRAKRSTNLIQPIIKLDVPRPEIGMIIDPKRDIYHQDASFDPKTTYVLSASSVFNNRKYAEIQLAKLGLKIGDGVNLKLPDCLGKIAGWSNNKPVVKAISSSLKGALMTPALTPILQEEIIASFPEVVGHFRTWEIGSISLSSTVNSGKIKKIETTLAALGVKAGDVVEVRVNSFGQVNGLPFNNEKDKITTGIVAGIYKDNIVIKFPDQGSKVLNSSFELHPSYVLENNEGYLSLEGKVNGNFRIADRQITGKQIEEGLAKIDLKIGEEIEAVVGASKVIGKVIGFGSGTGEINPIFLVKEGWQYKDFSKMAFVHPKYKMSETDRAFSLSKGSWWKVVPNKDDQIAKNLSTFGLKIGDKVEVCVGQNGVVFHGSLFHHPTTVGTVVGYDPLTSRSVIMVKKGNGFTAGSAVDIASNHINDVGSGNIIIPHNSSYRKYVAFQCPVKPLQFGLRVGDKIATSSRLKGEVIGYNDKLYPKIKWSDGSNGYLDPVLGIEYIETINGEDTASLIKQGELYKKYNIKIGDTLLFKTIDSPYVVEDVDAYVVEDIDVYGIPRSRIVPWNISDNLKAIKRSGTAEIVPVDMQTASINIRPNEIEGFHLNVGEGVIIKESGKFATIINNSIEKVVRYKCEDGSEGIITSPEQIICSNTVEVNQQPLKFGLNIGDTVSFALTKSDKSTPFVVVGSFSDGTPVVRVLNSKSSVYRLTSMDGINYVNNLLTATGMKYVPLKFGLKIGDFVEISGANNYKKSYTVSGQNMYGDILFKDGSSINNDKLILSINGSLTPWGLELKKQMDEQHKNTANIQGTISVKVGDRIQFYKDGIEYTILGKMGGSMPLRLVYIDQGVERLGATSSFDFYSLNGKIGPFHKCDLAELSELVPNNMKIGAPLDRKKLIYESDQLIQKIIRVGDKIKFGDNDTEYTVIGEQDNLIKLSAFNKKGKKFVAEIDNDTVIPGLSIINGQEVNGSNLRLDYSTLPRLIGDYSPGIELFDINPPSVQSDKFETKSEPTSQIKKEITAAGYRIAATQAINGSKSAIVNLLKNKGATNEHIANIGTLLDTEFGCSLVALTLGISTTHFANKEGANPMIGSFAKECRIQSMSILGNSIMETVISSALEALNNPPKELEETYTSSASIDDFIDDEISGDENNKPNTLTV